MVSKANSDKKIFAILFLISTFTFGQVYWPENSGLHYEGCADLVPEDFERMVTMVPEYPRRENGYLATIEPDKQGRIFYGVKSGVLGMFLPESDTHIELATLNNRDDSYMGLLGMALHPDFPEKPWIYVHYTPDIAPFPAGDEFPDFHLSRFTFADNKIELSSEVILMTSPFDHLPESGNAPGGTAHVGGRIRFGPDGNLYIMTGDNSSWDRAHYPLTSDENARTTGLNSSGNTNDFRGKVLRIRPEDDGSYSIPPGNLWEYYAGKLREQGRHTLADKYEDPSLVKREIFAMGMRSPIAIQIDRYTGWVGTSEAGPNKGGAYDEGGDDFHLMKRPGNNGYPFFYGRDYIYHNEDWDIGGGVFPDFNWDNPVNFSSWNTGVDTLPHGEKAIFQWEHSGDFFDDHGPDNMGFGPFSQLRGKPLSGVMGPIYWYDKNLESDVKMPPHLHGHMFVSNMYSPLMAVLKLHPSGDSVVSGDPIFRDMDFPREGGMNNGNGVLDMFLGYKGELYVSTFSGQISRIEYVGDCRPQNPDLAMPGCTDPNYAEYNPDATIHSDAACLTNAKYTPGFSNELWSIDKKNMTVTIHKGGAYSLSIYNVSGRNVASHTGGGPGLVDLGNVERHSGFYFFKLRIGGKSFTKRVLMF